MEKRFEFVIGIEDKQEDSTSFQYLTTKQIKAISLVLNMDIECYMDENGKNVEEVQLFPTCYLNSSEDDGFITDEYLSEILRVIENMLSGFYKNEQFREDKVSKEIKDIKRRLQEIDEIP